MSSVERNKPTAGRAGPSGETMRAIVQDRYGSVEMLEVVDVARPQAGDDRVLIRVEAAGLHIGDSHFLTGQPYLMRLMGFGFRGPKPRIRGTDVAGVVEAVGREADEFTVGDEVFGSCDGAFAEHATARPKTLAAKPVNLTFEQAAAVPTSGCTAVQALRAGTVARGQKVLIIGATGGVGSFAVQVAKAWGAEVTGVCSTGNVELLRAIGADHVIDYQTEGISDGGRRYDVILDTGGNRPLSQLRRALTAKGTLVLVGGEGGGRWIGSGMRRSISAIMLSPFVSQRLRTIAAGATAADLRLLKELIEKGRITPIIDQTYRLGETADAMRRLQAGHLRGKLIISG